VTDVRRLEHKIAKFASPASPVAADGREIGAVGRRDRLQAILQEIDEIILPSTLTFRNDGADALVLEVANRRLLRFNGAIAPQGEEGGELMTTGLVQAIDDLFAGAKPPRIRTSRLGRDIDPEEIGCSSAALAEAWGIDLYGSTSQDPAERLDTFMKACSDLSTAWFRLDAPGIIQKSGTEEDTGRLAALAESDLSAIDRSLNSCAADADGARCAILGPGDDGARSIAYIKAETSLALVMFASEDVSAFNALWQRVYQ